MRPTSFLSIALLTLAATAMGETNVSLRDAIPMALKHSHEFRAAQADSAAAGAETKSARADQWPTFSASATSYYVDDLQSFTIPGIGPNVAENRELGSRDNYQFDFRVTAPLFTGGKLRNQVDLKADLLAALTQNLEAGRQKVAYSTRRAYLNLMLTEAQVRAAEASLARMRLIRQDVGNLFTAGMADSLDLLEADLAVEQAARGADESVTHGRNSSTALATLLGLDLNDTLVASDSLPVPTIDELPHGQIERGNIERAELGVLRMQARAAERSMKLAKAAYFPVLSALGGYSVGRPNKDLFGQTWNDYFSAGLLLTWAFNAGGKTYRDSEAARNQARSAQASLQALEERMLAEAEIAQENLSQAFRTLESAQRESALARRQFALAQLQHQAGRLATNRILEQAQVLDVAELMQLAALVSYYLVENDYLYALGSARIYGGF